jgi:hypothetical protein
MNLRQIAVLVEATAGVARETHRALVGFERMRRMGASRSAAAALLVGAGIAIGTIAARPELRRKLRDLLVGKPTPGASTTADEPSHAEAARPESHVDGARP